MSSSFCFGMLFFRHWRRPLDDELPDLANLNDIHDLRTKEANKNDHIVWLSNYTIR